MTRQICSRIGKPFQVVSRLDESLYSLDRGEQAAISLAQTLPADLLIIDERLGRPMASDRQIPAIGILGILDEAAHQGLVQLSEAIAQLQQTNFRISRPIIQTLLKKRQ